MTKALLFRAWDNDNHCWQLSFTLNFTGGIIIREEDPAMRGKIMPAFYRPEHPRFDVEQFTGLYDRNDMEIYEGDIITQPFGAKPTVVEAGFEVHDDHEGAIGYRMPHGTSLVIGNIHESPELLK